MVHSFCTIVPTGQSPIPLENLAHVFDCQCPAGLVVRASGSIQCQYFLRRDLDVANGEIPYNVVTTLHFTRLPLGLYSSITREQAVAMLAELQWFREAGSLEEWENVDASDLARSRFARFVR